MQQSTGSGAVNLLRHGGFCGPWGFPGGGKLDKPLQTLYLCNCIGNRRVPYVVPATSQHVNGDIGNDSNMTHNMDNSLQRITLRTPLDRFVMYASRTEPFFLPRQKAAPGSWVPGRSCYWLPECLEPRIPVIYIYIYIYNDMVISLEMTHNNYVAT